MTHFLDQVRHGFRRTMDKNAAVIDRLAREGQHPKAMAIGCADSRVKLEEILGLGFGDSFSHTPVGNIIPRFDDPRPDDALACALQFEIEIKEVEHIILMGHTKCGAAEGMAGNITAPRMVPWLNKAQPAKKAAIAEVGQQDTTLLSQEIERQIVIMGIDNLPTYPDVQVAMEAGKLELHGMHYDMGKQSLLLLNQRTGQFEPFATASANITPQHTPDGACCE